MKKVLVAALPLVDALMAVAAFPSGLVLKFIRRMRVSRMPLSKAVLLRIGVFPVSNHYYEPQFDFREMKVPLSRDRPLLGINWNSSEQLALLSQFEFSQELADLPTEPQALGEFYFDNRMFEAGDAEFWYQMVRLKKPRRILEVGSGYSTLLAIKAIRAVQEEDPAYECEHICIEPYEVPWLEKSGVSVIRRKVEDVGPDVFAALQSDDILFIDSSHIIRPQGDVLFEILELLPLLKSGVIVHVHDIFSPKNYPGSMIEKEVRFWNEQYLLEAFLSFNCSWKIIGALNYLKHNHYEELQRVAPRLTPDKEPGSFYIQRVR